MRAQTSPRARNSRALRCRWRIPGKQQGLPLRSTLPWHSRGAPDASEATFVPTPASAEAFGMSSVWLSALPARQGDGHLVGAGGVGSGKSDRGREEGAAPVAPKEPGKEGNTRLGSRCASREGMDGREGRKERDRTCLVEANSCFPPQTGTFPILPCCPSPGRGHSPSRGPHPVSFAAIKLAISTLISS